MTNAHRTITTLLAVIAVLLVINLAVTSPSHEAQAQGVARGRPVEVVALQMEGLGDGVRVYRMFSDGTVEGNLGFHGGPGGRVVEWFGWQEIPEVPLVP